MLPKPFKIDPEASHRDLAKIIREKLKDNLNDENFNIVEGYRRDLVLMFEEAKHRKDFFIYLWNNHTDLHPRIKENNIHCTLGLVSLHSFPDKEYINDLIDNLRIKYYNK